MGFLGGFNGCLFSCRFSGGLFRCGSVCSRSLSRGFTGGFLRFFRCTLRCFFGGFGSGLSSSAGGLFFCSGTLSCGVGRSFFSRSDGGGFGSLSGLGSGALSCGYLAGMRVFCRI